MPNASDIGDSIEPGSLPYGDRQIVEENIQQAASQRAPVATPGAVSGAGMAKLNEGGVSDLPVTAGLSVGPGAGATGEQTAMSPTQVQLRMLAMEARTPLLRQLARDALRATVNRDTDGR